MKAGIFFIILASGIFFSCNETANKPVGKKVLLQVISSGSFEQEVTYRAHTYDINKGRYADEEAVLKYRLASANADNSINVFSGDLISVRTASDMLGKAVIYNSSNSLENVGKPMIGDIVPGLLTKKLSFSIGENGKVLKNIEFKGSNSHNAFQPFKLNFYFINFPDAEVEKGDRWETDYIDTITREKVTSKYKISDINKDVALIDAWYVITDKYNKKETYLNGVYIIDLNTGIPLTVNINSKSGVSGIETTYHFTTKISLTGKK